MRGATQAGLRKLFLSGAAEVSPPVAAPLSLEKQFDESTIAITPLHPGGRGRVAYLGFCFLAIFVGFLAPQGLLTVLFPNVGFNVLAIIYYVFSLSALLAPLLSRLDVDPKWSMWVAALFGYFFWVGSMLTEKTWVIYMASALLGVAAGALWVSEGLYVTRSRCGEQGHNLFMLIFVFSSVVSSLISGLVLRYLPASTFIAIFCGICGTGAMMIAFAPPAKVRLPDEQRREVTLRTVFFSLRVLAEYRMYLLLPTMWARSCVSAFVVSTLPTMLPSAQVVPWVLLTNAIVVLLCCGVVLLFALRVPVYVWSAIHSGGIVLAMILVGCSLLADVDSRLYMLYVVGGLLGVNEGVGQFLTNAFMSSLFLDDPGSAFSVMRCVESLNFACMAIMAAYTPPLVLICIAGVAAVASLLSIVRLFVLIRRKKEADLAAAKMTATEMTTAEVKVAIVV